MKKCIPYVLMILLIVSVLIGCEADVPMLDGPPDFSSATSSSIEESVPSSSMPSSAPEVQMPPSSVPVNLDGKTEAQTNAVFVTEGIASITLFGYYGSGTGCAVPSEQMDAMIVWLQSFEAGSATEGLLPPGTNTNYIEIQYTDGRTVRNGFDTVVRDGVTYHTVHDPIPEFVIEILTNNR